MAHNQIAADGVPDYSEDQNRQADPQCSVPSVINWQCSKATIGRLAFKLPRARAGHQPTGEPQPNSKEKRYG